MSALPRKTQKLFGTSAGANEMATEFGSLAAAAPSRTTGALVDPSLIQSLAQYTEGWFAAVLGLNAIAIEDFNSLCYLFAYQLTYILEHGVPEYDAGTNYFINDKASYLGTIVVSLNDNNLGNAVTSISNWKVQGGGITAVSTTYVVLTTDENIRCDTSGGSFTVTLPALATVPLGKTYFIKNVSLSGNTVGVVPNGSENIDAQIIVNLTSGATYLPGITVRKSSATTWDMV